MAKKSEVTAAAEDATNVTLVSVDAIDKALLEAQQNLDNLRKQQTEALQTRKTQIENDMTAKRQEFENALAALQSGFDAEHKTLADELTIINGKLGIVVAPVAAAASNAIASTFKDSDIPKGMAREAFAKLAVLSFRPSSLDERLLMIFGNAGEGVDVNIETLVIACKVTGHVSKSDNIKPSISTALVRLKGNKKWIKATGRGLYQISAKGLKEFASLVKSAGKPAYQGGAAGSENMPRSANALNLKSLSDFILVHLNQVDKTCTRVDIVNGVIPLGFQTKIKDPKQLTSSLQSSLKSLVESKYITEAKVGVTTHYTITAAGKAVAKEKEAEAKAA